MAVESDSAPKAARQCDITRTANAMARRTRVCEQCGTTFIQGSLSRKQREAGHVARFCSNACRAKSVKVHESQAAAKRAEYQRWRMRRELPPISEILDCERCGLAFRPRQYTMRRCPECSRSGSQARAQYRCQCCGTTYGYEKTGGKPRQVCSEHCANEVRKAWKKRAKLLRKGRLRMPGSETVIAHKVLERDGWRCRACGCPTPKASRGTNADDAPELDHIVPLAKGGAHSYANTQCLCRRCNLLKGAIA